MARGNHACEQCRHFSCEIDDGACFMMLTVHAMMVLSQAISVAVTLPRWTCTSPEPSKSSA
jgi:hypothetical protein